jgi:ABC-type multidrug transport system ATPase subunit
MAAAELFGLRKVFPGKAKCLKRKPASDFWAIKGSWLGIEESQLFCLLGPNGAGKTTTINCLTGVLPITGGDAFIYGESISSEGGLDRIRSLMGVCPQFDVLWGELTGMEHLIIYGHVKGVPFSQVRGQAQLFSAGS